MWQRNISFFTYCFLDFRCTSRVLNLPTARGHSGDDAVGMSRYNIKVCGQWPNVERFPVFSVQDRLAFRPSLWAVVTMLSITRCNQCSVKIVSIDLIIFLLLSAQVPSVSQPPLLCIVVTMRLKCWASHNALKMIMTAPTTDVTMLFFDAQGHSAFQPPLGTVVTMQVGY